MYRIRCQASIFKLAESVAGLCLKPAKCVIIVSCVELSDELEAGIRLWLSQHVPEFEVFCIASSGKYLGFYLGVDSCFKSFQEPLEKLDLRVREIVAANAPVTSNIIKFNQKVVPVLSYVSQFAFPPGINFIAKEMWCVHKLLRLPARCMSRELCHSIAFCTEVDPIPLTAYCCAVMLRFAHSEKEYLTDLLDVVCSRYRVSPRSDGTPLASINVDSISNNLMGIPMGGLSDPPISVSLMHALHLSGDFSCFKDNCRNDPPRNWLVHYPTVSFPSVYKSFQSAALEAFSIEARVNSLSVEIRKKARISLLPFAPFWFPNGWFERLHIVLREETPYIKICWLRTIVGGWCTATRLHSVQYRPCIYGCSDARDELSHYLQCPILWQFARSTLRINEPSIHFLSRLCIAEPTSDKLKLLAFSHALYHSCVNDNSCMTEDGMPKSFQIVQQEASEACNFCLHLISNKT